MNKETEKEHSLGSGRLCRAKEKVMERIHGTERRMKQNKQLSFSPFLFRGSQLWVK